jgi:hypothetical protein
MVQIDGPDGSELAPGGGRMPTRSLWPEWCALCVYAALVVLAIPYHEPWVDEAQAWQLARSLSLASLFKNYIRYEGSPGLWHFLLWVMNRLHIGYGGMHWISGAIAVAAISLLIFNCPFPRYLKLSLPFTFFLSFQYAVVARNYVLAPLFFFGVAMSWKKSPLGVALALGLLANVSLHLAVLSGGLATVYAIEHIRNRDVNALRNNRKLLYCGLILLALYAFAIWTAWPPHDLGLSRVRGESRPFVSSAIASLAWAICDPSILSAPFWAIIALWFVARRKLLYLLPVLFFAIFSGAVYYNFWQAGLLVPCLICILWITWPVPGSRPYEFDKAAQFALAVLIVTQVLWSGYALFYDHYYAYSPDPAAAEFLKPFVKEGATIAVTYLKDDNTRRIHGYPSVGILPYFDHNIYANTPFAFWWWSDRDPSEDRFAAVLSSHPRIVLVEVGALHPVPKLSLDEPLYTSLAKDGYQFRRTFCGSQPQGFQLGITLCHVIFESADTTGFSGM